MSRLIYADLKRVFKSKLVYIVFAASIVIPILYVIVNINMCETGEEAMLFPVTANELLSTFASLLPAFAGMISAIFIGTEFSKGVIRNKILTAKSRTTILLSWIIIYVVITFISFALYFASLFIAVKIGGIDMSGVDSKAVLLNLFIIFLFAIKFQMLTFIFLMLIPDEKATAIVYFANVVLMLPFAILCEVSSLKTFMSYFSRLNLYGLTLSGNFDLGLMPDKAWLTILIVVALIVVYFVIAKILFKKKDLK